MAFFPLKVVAIEIAEGNVSHGCVRYELAVPGTTVVERLKERGIQIREYSK